jgi:hypothetical protein
VSNPVVGVGSRAAAVEPGTRVDESCHATDGMEAFVNEASTARGRALKLP